MPHLCISKSHPASRISRAAKFSRLSAAVLCAAVLVLPNAGCSSARRQAKQPFGGPAPATSVRIDRTENGAALPGGRRHDASSTPNRLLFETAGVAPLIGIETTREQFAAARQAAVFDALRRAILAWRCERGLVDANFEHVFSSRMRVGHSTGPDGYDFRVHLVIRGSQQSIHLRDGSLMHPPCDTAVLDRVFAETGGTFAWLPSSSEPPGYVVARVGCYATGPPVERLAGTPGDADAGMGDRGIDAATP